MAFLATSVSLEHLDVSSTWVADDDGWQSLARLPKLRALVASSCGALRTVNKLASSTSLEELDLSFSDLTSADLACLARLPTLRKVNLGGCKAVSDVHFLLGSTALTELDVSHTSVETPTIVGLERIPTLTGLRLSGCPVTSVSFLAASRSLRYLLLDGTRVTSDGIAGLERIPTLTTLNLVGCASLTSVKNLQSCRSLRRLTVECASVPRADLTKLQARLPRLEILGTPASQRSSCVVA